jgi:hypothetical protein
MPKCLVCKNKLEEKRTTLCVTCYDFFAWKYGKNLKIRVAQLTAHLKETETQLNARRYK